MEGLSTHESMAELGRHLRHGAHTHKKKKDESSDFSDGYLNVSSCYSACQERATNWCTRPQTPLVVQTGERANRFNQRSPNINSDKSCGMYCISGCSKGPTFQLDCPNAAVRSCFRMNYGPVASYRCLTAATFGCLNAFRLEGAIVKGWSTAVEARAVNCTRKCSQLWNGYCNLRADTAFDELLYARRRLTHDSQPMVLGNRFINVKEVSGCHSACNIGCGFVRGTARKGSDDMHLSRAHPPPRPQSSYAFLFGSKCSDMVARLALGRGRFSLFLTTAAPPPLAVRYQVQEVLRGADRGHVGAHRLRRWWG